MVWHSCFPKHLSILVPALLLLAHGSLKADPLTVMESTSPAGTNYLYDFAITNLTSSDPYFNLISVDFSLPAGTVIGMASAPAGNGASTDPSGNFVEFSSNNVSGFPVGTKVDGFQFTSAATFPTLQFTANYLNTTGLTLTTFTGTTVSASQASAVPEPSTLGLLAGASLLAFGRIRKLRNR